MFVLGGGWWVVRMPKLNGRRCYELISIYLPVFYFYICMYVYYVCRRLDTVYILCVTISY